MKHYVVLDVLYDWEEYLQESIEDAAEHLAAGPMQEDEEVPMLEDDVSQPRITKPTATSPPENPTTPPSRPTEPKSTAPETRPKRTSAKTLVEYTESEMKKQDYYFVEEIFRHSYKRGWRSYTR